MPDSSTLAVIGVDAGNTKPASVCVNASGRLVAHAVVGRSNYQTTGAGPALERLWEAVEPLAESARGEGLAVAGFGFGLTGLDRPRDRSVLDRLVRDLMDRVAARASVPVDPPCSLENDACLVLRAGTDDGVGVAVSSGTGGNCVGRGRDGRRVQIGGISSELGDGGGAHDIAIAGLRAAGRARDGRGPATAITDIVCAFLGLERIEDIIDFTIPGNQPDGLEDGEPPSVSLLAPFVFEAAKAGDAVARRVLEDIGRDLGLSARLAASRLFGRDEEFPLVLGGGVLMNAADPVFADAIVAEARSEFPRARPVMLDCHPVAGAALLALDALAARGAVPGLADGLADGTLRRALGPQLAEAM